MTNFCNILLQYLEEIYFQTRVKDEGNNITTKKYLNKEEYLINMSKIEDEFSEDNFLSLAMACYQIAELIKEGYESGCDSLIIPSRGAFPIYKCVKYALLCRTRKEKDYKEFVEAIEFPEFTGSVASERVFQIIPYPLTADVYIRDEILNKYKKTLTEVTDDIRDYGADVISTFLLPSEERMASDKFSFLYFIHTCIEGRKAIGEYYRRLKPIKKPIILDTAISGRAFYTISKRLTKDGIDHYGIVVADKQGSKMKEPYKNWFFHKREKGEVEIVPTERIMSEDRGTGLLGVTACLYPELALEAERSLGIDPCAGVTWHILPKQNRTKNINRMNEYHTTFKSYISALRDAISLLDRKNNRRTKMLEKSFESRIRETTRKLKEYKLLSYPDPYLDPRLFVGSIPIRECYETSSHVIHIFFKDNNGLIKKYKSTRTRKS